MSRCGNVANAFSEEHLLDCDLEEGHKGDHTASGENSIDGKWKVTWEGRLK